MAENYNVSIFSNTGILLHQTSTHDLNPLINHIITSTGSLNTVESFNLNPTTSYKYISSKTTTTTVFFNPNFADSAKAESLCEVAHKLWFAMMDEQMTANGKNKLWLGTDLDIEKFAQYWNAKVAEAVVSNAPAFLPVVEATANKKVKKTVSKQRKWNADGTFTDGDADSSALDFSESHGSSTVTADLSQFQSNNDDSYLLSDIDELLNRKNETTESFSFLKKYLGGKTITAEDIESITNELTQHLISKNVSPEAAEFMLAQVTKSLTGTQTTKFTSLQSTVRKALSDALKNLLTPSISTDLLHDIQFAGRPYVLSMLGVNGVGKSTTLSKLAFWLLKNNLKVLVCACDTFRSGAVEQLRVHVNNLQQLSSSGHIELFEGGYGGADLAAKVAKGAVQHAAKNGFDVVLIDTAGRRHNDATLMTPLASFVSAAKPDKIIMVAEALVGNDSLGQAQNFNKALAKAGRKVDFFIVSKCDTVGDMLGSVVSLVWTSGTQVLFVGVGQVYTDLRVLSVDWVVDSLMR